MELTESVELQDLTASVRLELIRKEELQDMAK
jgi:hypothetical protein